MGISDGGSLKSGRNAVAVFQTLQELKFWCQCSCWQKLSKRCFLRRTQSVFGYLCCAVISVVCHQSWRLPPREGIENAVVPAGVAGVTQGTVDKQTHFHSSFNLEQDLSPKRVFFRLVELVSWTLDGIIIFSNKEGSSAEPDCSEKCVHVLTRVMECYLKLLATKYLIGVLYLQRGSEDVRRTPSIVWMLLEFCSLNACRISVL